MRVVGSESSQKWAKPGVFLTVSGMGDVCGGFPQHFRFTDEETPFLTFWHLVGPGVTRGDPFLEPKQPRNALKMSQMPNFCVLWLLRMPLNAMHCLCDGDHPAFKSWSNSWCPKLTGDQVQVVFRSE